MIAACHARAVAAGDTDWIAIAAYYQALASVAPSPIVEINRAVAVGMAFGPAQGLAIADALRDEPCLKESHLLPTVRGDFLEKLGHTAEARAEFRRAAELTGNERERALLLARANARSAHD
jgi:predicted RNA polymerase sigma factor